MIKSKRKLTLKFWSNLSAILIILFLLSIIILDRAKLSKVLTLILVIFFLLITITEFILLWTKSRCPYCGKAVLFPEKYCSKCGNYIEDKNT